MSFESSLCALKTKPKFPLLSFTHLHHQHHQIPAGCQEQTDKAPMEETRRCWGNYKDCKCVSELSLSFPIYSTGFPSSPSFKTHGHSVKHLPMESLKTTWETQSSQTGICSNARQGLSDFPMLWMKKIEATAMG